jgi:hypothetical protein
MVCLSCKPRTLLDCSSLLNHVRHNHLGPEVWFAGKQVRPDKMQELDVGDLKVCHFFGVWLREGMPLIFSVSFSAFVPSSPGHHYHHHRQHVVEKCRLHLLVPVRKGDHVEKNCFVNPTNKQIRIKAKFSLFCTCYFPLPFLLSAASFIFISPFQRHSNAGAFALGVIRNDRIENY